MLVNWTQPKHVFIVCGKTDLRKGIDGLAVVVAENYDLDLFDDSLFLFCGTRNDRFKGLYWDGEGFILLFKRFESRFQLNFGAGFVKFIEVRLAFGQARDKVGQSQIVQLGITQNPAL